MSTKTNANEAATLTRAFYAAADESAVPTSKLEVFVSDRFKDHNRPKNIPMEVPDKAALLGLFSALRAAFPNGKHSLDILEPIGADKAMVYWTFTGRQTGTFFGKPASGNFVSINGVDIFRVEGGQFVEQWHVEELMSLFAQIDA
jgi:predicted ester cyclase